MKGSPSLTQSESLPSGLSGTNSTRNLFPASSTNSVLPKASISLMEIHRCSCSALVILDLLFGLGALFGLCYAERGSETASVRKRAGNNRSQNCDAGAQGRGWNLCLLWKKSSRGYLRACSAVTESHFYNHWQKTSL